MPTFSVSTGQSVSARFHRAWIADQIGWDDLPSCSNLPPSGLLSFDYAMSDGFRLSGDCIAPSASRLLSTPGTTLSIIDQQLLARPPVKMGSVGSFTVCYCSDVMKEGLSVHVETAFVTLFSIATAVALIARWSKIPYTVALVVAGLVAARSVPWKRPHLTKELLYALFLPGLVFEVAFHLDAQSFGRTS